MKTYQDFLASKRVSTEFAGIEPREPHPMLFDFQRDIVKWALRRGRACIWADCGLGKTLMQLEWARQVPGDVLILLPLAVASQTVEEGSKIDLPLNYCRDESEVKPGITITNYQMLDHFENHNFAGVVLDESSILKSFTGKFRNEIIRRFEKVPYRLACTATPAPNDHMELGNHAEFIGAMTRTEMLSMFFVHDGGETSQWRLKGHAQAEFWKWLCSWAVMLRKPSDLGYGDGQFILPPLAVEQITVEYQNRGDYLFALEASTLQERLRARRDSISDRVARCAALVNASDEAWLIWCNLNDEADELETAIIDAEQIAGADELESKLDRLARFISGDLRALISKPSICGHGLNLQHCRNVAFVGLSDSWEQYYQAVRRCWRFGQRNEVRVRIITSTAEGAVIQNIKRKEQEADQMASEMVKHMQVINQANLKATIQTRDDYTCQRVQGKSFTLYNDDCVEAMRGIEANSIGFSVFSPPFASLYTYSASERDMGNTKDDREFFDHLKFMIAELKRVLMPGRNVSIHCLNLPSMKSRQGYIGLRDFRGELIRAFEAKGFIYHSEVCIWKDPVTAMQRTKALGLLWKQLKKDSAMSRMGIADYVVTMRKPGENAQPIHHTADDFPVDLWQKWASPIWMDIDPGDTLQFRNAREFDDERHICPLQLEVIRRSIMLWSNPGDLVLSPFAGIGSEGHVAIHNRRRFVGIELKESYFKTAEANLRMAEEEAGRDLFQGIMEPASA